MLTCICLVPFPICCDDDCKVLPKLSDSESSVMSYKEKALKTGQHLLLQQHQECIMLMTH